jgi:hypothetical protein
LAPNEGERSVSHTSHFSLGKREGEVGNKLVLTLWSKEILLPLAGIEFEQPAHPTDSPDITLIELFDL